MTSTEQIATHFRAVYFGGNWTSVNVRDTLAGITWQQATTRLPGLHTIATLVFHLNYYVSPVLKVLQGAPLEASDASSFQARPLPAPTDWQKLVDKALTEAEAMAAAIEKLPEVKLTEDFTDPKYGSYYHNLHGIIEHTHYHLGQIVLLKKMLTEPIQGELISDN